MAKAFKLHDRKAPKFNDDYKVLDQVVLNQTNIQGNNNKFYVMELQEHKGNFRVFTHYGRVGADGVKEGRYFTDGDNLKEAAEKEFARINKAKQKKGYLPVDLAQANVGSGKIKKELPRSKRTVKSSLDERVERFVEQIYEEASKSLAQAIMTPLGALSEAQIEKGYEKLDQIRTAISYDDAKLLNELSSKFYSLIPQRFSHRIDPKEAIIDSDHKADRQEELLQLMKDVYNVKDNLGSELLQKYHAINTKVTPLEPGSREFKRIVKKVAKTHSRHHNVKLHVNRIYEIELNATKGKYNPSNLKEMELFHGSANRNILGILQRGLLISPPCANFTGAAFGRGIYFADKSTKSSQYSTLFYQNVRNNGFLFLADVAVGKMLELHDYSFSSKLPKGYDSVRGVTGRTLLHDEFIVYTTQQSNLKYIIDFTPKGRGWFR